MEQDYPFEMPEATLEKLEEADVRATLCRKYAYSYGLRNSLGNLAFEGWSLVFFPLMEVLENLSKDDRRDSDQIWSLFQVAKTLKDDFTLILKLSSWSLPYDPMVRKIMADTAGEYEALYDDSEASTPAQEPCQPVPPTD